MKERTGLLKAHNRDMVNASHGMSSQSQSYDNNLELTSEEGSNQKKMKYLIRGIIVTVIIVIAIILGVVLGKGGSKDPQPNPGPTPDPTPTPSIQEGYNLYQGVISEQHPSGVYGVANFVQHTQLKGSQSLNITTHPQNISLGQGNNITNQIKWSIEVTGLKQATFKAENNLQDQYEVPLESVNQMFNVKQGRLEQLGITPKVDPLGFEISSFFDSQILVSTVNQTLYMTDKYLQMDFKLPTQHLFGFGERNREFKLSEGTWTMWASGQQASYDDGTGFKQSYGVHPFLLVKARNSTKSDEYFGMFFRNTNGQSPVIKFNDDGTSILSYITIGGKIEVNFFLKGSAKEIIAQYHNFIGKPALPPFWALGFHQNSKLINDSKTYAETIQNFSMLGIKLEALWLDVQYMNDQQEFTLNQNMTNNIDSLLREAKSNNVKLIPVVGNGIKLSDSLLQLKADSSQCLLNDLQGELYSEKSIADQTLFLDWFLEDSYIFWGENLSAFYQLFSNSTAGFALDLNENTIYNTRNYPSNKSICQTQENGNDTWYLSCLQENETQFSTYNLPFIPSKRFNFDYMSVDLNATHPGSNNSEYNVHSLNGHMQLQTTYWNLQNDSLFESAFVGKRSFIMSRSTFAGSGQYGGHFFGDNDQTFEGLKMYINSILNFNMFGMPFSGGSICGMRGATQQQQKDVEELCGAWFQVAAWVPFAYQNIDDKTITSDISKLPLSLQQTAIGSLNDRLIHLRHIYTCLFMSHLNGGSCYDPVYFHFPELEIQEYSNTFIVGDAILVQPVVSLRQQGNNFYETFFPPGDWLNLRTKVIERGKSETGNFFNVSFTSIGAANAWLRQGFIIQQQYNSSAKNSEDIFKTPISLLAHLDKNKHAEGYIFLDDGFSDLEYDDQANHEIYKIVINGGSIFAFDQNQNEKPVNINRTGVNNITIFGELDYHFVDFACYISKDNRKVTNLTISKPDDQTLTMQNLNGKIDFSVMNVIHFGNSKKELNLCGLNLKQITNYTWKEPIIMVGNTFTGTLISDKTFVESLKVNFSLLATPKGDTVSVSWNYENEILANKTFKLPNEIINMSQYNLSKTTNKFTLKDYIHIDYNQSAILFSIVNPQSNNSEIVFNLTGLILDGYLNVIESQAILNEKEPGIIGLGQYVGNKLHLDKGVYSMWSGYEPQQNQNRTLASNLQGTHPFYMGMDRAQSWFGVFTRLSSAQDWWIEYLDNDSAKSAKIQTISTGNSAGEMYFIFADTAPQLVSTYHQNIVGLPVLNPFWALGWHQSRQGYANDSELREVFDKYNNFSIPLDTLWSDVDYMDNYKDFTVDLKNFAGLPQLISDLHTVNKHYIPIVESGIAFRPNSNYTPFTEGKNNGYFITYDKDQDPLIGQFWSGETVFPDFSQNDTKIYWQSWLTAMQKEIQFDGLWLDINEASNDCSGICIQNQRIEKPVKDLLPYIPTGKDLETDSLSLDAYHKGNGAIELDMHSLFGTLEVATTSDWFKKAGKRPIIIEGGGFAGIGKYGSRWMGDNLGHLSDMSNSLVGVQANNIFGIPLIGADICGSLGRTTPELCARWHVVGSFYPFSRNHKDSNRKSQEPYLFTEIYERSTSYSDIMIQAIRNKYRIAKYYYTQMYLLSKNGGSFIQPLFFQFPQDVNSREDQQYNMMIGEALKLGINSDKLDQNFTSIVFPQGATWCNLLYSKEELKSCIIGGPNKQNRSSKAYEFDLHLRDGYIVPLQNTQNVTSTYDLLQKPVELHINLRCVFDKSNKKDCQAEGTLVNDDGSTLTSNSLYKSVIFTLKLSADPFIEGEQTLKMQLDITKEQPSDYDCNNNFVSQIYIHNADNFFNNKNYTVTVNNKSIGVTMIEKSSNRLMLDLSSQPVDISKLDGNSIVFDLQK